MSNKISGNTKGNTPKKLNNAVKPAVEKQPVTVNANCKGMELFSLRQCDMVMRLDAPLLTTNTEKFKQCNRLTYYVLINTWLFQVEDVAGPYYFDLMSYIMRYGLVTTIQECANLSNRLITQYGDPNYDSKTSPFIEQPGFSYVVAGIVTSCTSERQVLQLLRYPKRFCPSHADLVTDRGLASFVLINDWCKETNTIMETTCVQKKWAHAIRPTIAGMLKYYKYDLALASFSNGTAADADMPLGEKIRAYAELASSFDDDGRYPVVSSSRRKLNRKDYTCVVKAVPKSYKTPRIIAMESAYRQYHMQAIRRALEKSISRTKFGKWIDTHDQDPNRDMCFEGSAFGHYATIDLSSASDSLSRSFARECFPLDVFSDMEKYLAKYMQVPNERNARKVHMFSTSGSALTFPCESIVFFAICYECTEIVQTYLGQKLLPPRCFGDDMVVDNRVYDTVIDVLTTLRFFVNNEKSFGGVTTYRESCGVEYFRGLRLDSNYFPRADLDWFNKLPQALASLCSLQHKLYSCRKARLFLDEFVRGIEPRMTSHIVGAECSDLWSAMPTFELVFPPTLRKRPQLSKWNRVRKDLGLPYEDEFKNWSPVDLPLEIKRERYLAIKSNYPTIVKHVDSELLSNIDMWRYRHFLMHGPTYEDGLSELLRVSQSSLPLSHMLYKSKSKWEYVQ